MDFSKFLGASLKEDDERILTRWFDLYTDQPLTEAEILSMDNALAVAFNAKFGTLDPVNLCFWLHSTSYSGTYRLVLNQYQRPDGVYVWTVTPYVFNLLRRLLAPFRSIISSRFS